MLGSLLRSGAEGHAAWQVPMVTSQSHLPATQPARQTGTPHLSGPTTEYALRGSQKSPQSVYQSLGIYHIFKENLITQLRYIALCG